MMDTSGTPPSGTQQTRARAADLVALLIEKTAPWLLAIGLLVVLRELLFAAAQKDTLTDLWLFLLSREKVTKGMAFLFGAFGILYGLQQRELRRRAAARRSHRIAQLEQLAAQKDASERPAAPVDS